MSTSIGYSIRTETNAGDLKSLQHPTVIFHRRTQAKHFCRELSKQLEVRYKSHPLPVDLIEEGRDIEYAIIPSVAHMSAEADQIRNLIRDRRM